MFSIFLFGGTDNSIPGLQGYNPTKEAIQNDPRLANSLLILEKFPYWNTELTNDIASGFLELTRVPIFEFHYRVHTNNSEVSWRAEDCELYEQNSVRLLVCIQDWGNKSNPQNATAFRESLNLEPVSESIRFRSVQLPPWVSRGWTCNLLEGRQIHHLHSAVYDIHLETVCRYTI
jgi:hypothetical protein